MLTIPYYLIRITDTNWWYFCNTAFLFSFSKEFVAVFFWEGNYLAEVISKGSSTLEVKYLTTSKKKVDDQPSYYFKNNPEQNSIEKSQVICPLKMVHKDQKWVLKNPSKKEIDEAYHLRKKVSFEQDLRLNAVTFRL